MNNKFLYADSDEIQIVVEKANPYRDGATGRFTTGGGGGVSNVQSKAIPKNELSRGAIKGETHTADVTIGEETFKLSQINEKFDDDTIIMNVSVKDANGKMVARLGTSNQTINNKKYSQITGVEVHTKHQRKGIATTMLSFAREHSLDGIEIKHSDRLSPEGRAWAEVVKYNPNHDSRGRFTSGSGGGAPLASTVPAGKLNETYFENKANEAYKTGTEDEFTIANTGDESTAALGTYLAKGHIVNDHIRSGQMDEYLTDERKVSDVVSGLDNAIEMAPRMPKQTVFRVGNAEAVGKLRKGSIYEDKGFSSTTVTDLTHPDNGIQLLTLAKVSGGQKSIMRINTGNEGKGIYMPKMFPNQPIAEFEKEFLMPRNTKMKYLGEDYLFLENQKVITIYDFKVVA